MEIIAAKSKDLTGTSNPSRKGEDVNESLSGFAATFTELTRKLSAQIEGDPSAMAAHTVLSAVHDRTEPASASDQNLYERRDDLGGSQAQDRNQGTQHREDRFDDHPVEYAGDSGREQSADHGANRADDTAASRPEHADAPRENHQDANEGRADDGGSANRTAEASDGNRPERGDAQSQTASSEQGQGVATAAGEAVQSQALSGQQTAEQMLAGALTMVQTSELPGQMAANASDRAVEVSTRGEALSEISAALTATGKRVSAVGTGAHQAGNQGQHANANANAQGQAQAQAQAEAAAMADNGAAKQAAALSRLVGEGNRVAVNVGVAEEAASIVSQPTATATAAAVLAAETGSKKGTGQPAQHGNAATATLAQNAQAAQQAATGAQTQAQQNAAQAAQTQAVTANATEAKATTQAGVHANAGAQQVQAGGEATAQTNTGTANEATQAQKAAAQQAVTPQKQAAFRQAVVDQVTVQITKAFHAGTDKINIQLKPAALGRIDVQLEVASDGRVSAIVTADNKDTLEMLQRDAKDLAKALQDAGLHADAGNMNFNLREQNREAPEKGPDGPAVVEDGEFATEIADEDLNAVMAAGYRGGVDADGHVDIRA